MTLPDHALPPASSAPIFLTRVVRVGILRVQDAIPETPGIANPKPAAPNGLVGTPAFVGLGAIYEVSITVRGTPHQQTGYVIGIQELDAVVRQVLAPCFQAAFTGGARAEPAAILAAGAPGVQRLLPATVRLHALVWRPSPFLSIEWRPAMPDSALLAERFEFAAAHRLHCANLSDAENRRIFGKCNNEHGHGHNYRLEVCVRVPLRAGVPALGTVQLEDIVARTVIARFDHKNLNLDVEEFRTTVPSVENIAAACHAMLIDPITRAGGELARVTVWETDKTSATYPAAGFE